MIKIRKDASFKGPWQNCLLFKVKGKLSNFGCHASLLCKADFPAKNVNTSCRVFLWFSLAKNGHEVNCLPLRASLIKFYTVICRFDVIYIHLIILCCRSWWHFPSGFLNTLKGYTEDIIVEILAQFPIRLYFKIFSTFSCLFIYAIVNWSLPYLPKPHL